MPKVSFTSFLGGLWLPGGAAPRIVGDPDTLPAVQPGFAIPRNALLQADNVDFDGSGMLRGRRGSALYAPGSLSGGILSLHRHYPRAGVAQMGPAFPVFVDDDATVGTIAWNVTTGTGELGGGNANVNLSADDVSHYLRLRGPVSLPVVPVPLTAVLTGVEVLITRRGAPNAGIRDSSIRLTAGGVAIGLDRAKALEPWPTFFTTEIYGGAADLWGTTLTPADVNDGTFGVLISATSGLPIQQAGIDAVRIIVYFEEDTTPLTLTSHPLTSPPRVEHVLVSPAGFAAIPGGTLPELGVEPRYVTWPEKNQTFIFDGVNAMRSFNGTQMVEVIGSGFVGPRRGPYATLYKSRLVVTDPDELDFSVYASRVEDESNYDSNLTAGGAIQISCNDELGGTISGLGVLVDTLLIAKTTCLWSFEGDLEFGGILRRYSEMGCVAPRSWVQIPGGFAFVGRDGIYLTDGHSPEPLLVSAPIAHLWLDRQATRTFNRAVAVYHPRRDQLRVKLDPTHRDTYVLHRVQVPAQPPESVLAWSRIPDRMMTAACSYRGDPGAPDLGELIAGDGEGVVREWDIGLLDEGAAIRSIVQTPSRDFGDGKTGHAYHYKPFYRGRKMLRGVALHYDNQPVPQIVLGNVGRDLPAPEVQQPRYTIVDMVERGRFVSTVLESTESSDFEFYGVDLQCRLSSVRRWT